MNTIDAPESFRLRCGLLYAGVDKRLQCALVDRDEALVFDGRDNAEAKRAFWETVSGYAFTVETVEGGGE